MIIRAYDRKHRATVRDLEIPTALSDGVAYHPSKTVEYVVI